MLAKEIRKKTLEELISLLDETSLEHFKLKWWVLNFLL